MTDKDSTRESGAADEGLDDARRTARAALLAGAGARARETAAVLVALSGLETGTGAKSRAPLSLVALDDLEELLGPRPVEGLLILESGRVPPEDIGFVRRFLERNAGWRLIVLGEDGQDARARALLALRRAQWLPWPPDLAELRALLAPVPARTEARSEARPNGAREERGTPRRPPARRAAPAPGAGFDLGDLVEELLAGAALEGSGTPRYQFRSSETFRVERERAPLLEGLAGLVELARRCAGDDGLVRAALEPAGEAVVIGIDFPLGGLGEKDLPELLERAPAAGLDPELSEGVRAARQGVALLEEAGGRVELKGGEPGRVRCEVRLRADVQPAQRGARGGKPDDPFA